MKEYQKIANVYEFNPDIGKYLYDADGHMLKCKVKYRDVRRTENE